jgi:hypothetical protein
MICKNSYESALEWTDTHTHTHTHTHITLELEVESADKIDLLLTSAVIVAIS